MTRASFQPPRILPAIFISFYGKIQLLLLMFFMFSTSVSADTNRSPNRDRIYLERVIPVENGGYGYRLQYYVPAQINTFWQFKTDFDNDIMLTSDELIEHRLVESSKNSVITENRYATAPDLKFLWQTTVYPRQYRLEFRLLNADDCRHDFHYGIIELSPAGNYTKVTQTAFFDFFGASLWVKYPWNGGMKSMLTKVEKKKKKIASTYSREYMAVIMK